METIFQEINGHKKYWTFPYMGIKNGHHLKLTKTWKVRRDSHL